MEKESKILHCLYCGNKTLMEQVGSHTSNWDDENGYYGSFTYKMYLCPVCKRVTFYQHYESSAYEDDEEILYPYTIVDFFGVPIEIKSAFESAVKTKSIDSAICILSLRRTLEMICKDKEAVGDDLYKKIDDLILKKILPEMMSDISYIIRKYGNDAAHGDDLEFSRYEVEQIINYVSTIINYLYSLPSSVSLLKKELEFRKIKKVEKITTND